MLWKANADLGRKCIWLIIIGSRRHLLYTPGVFGQQSGKGQHLAKNPSWLDYSLKKDGYRFIWLLSAYSSIDSSLLGA